MNTLQHVNKRYNWICHAYCLMTNHYHLLWASGRKRSGQKYGARPSWEKKRKDILEIPWSRRYAHRPSLDKLFGKDERLNLRRRRGAIVKAVEQYGYRQQEAASHLGLHYSSVSRIMKGGQRLSSRKT